MKPLAVVSADQRTERAMRPGLNPWPSQVRESPLAVSKRPHGSEASAENDAKDSKRDSYAIPSRILKPNIYYEAHNFAHQVVAA